MEKFFDVVTTNPLAAIGAVFLVSSLAGLSVLLLSQRRITVRVVVGTMLYRGILSVGAACAVIWWQGEEFNVWLIFGVGALIGMTELSATDILEMVLTRMGWKKDEGPDSDAD